MTTYIYPTKTGYAKQSPDGQGGWRVERFLAPKTQGARPVKPAPQKQALHVPQASKAAAAAMMQYCFADLKLATMPSLEWADLAGACWGRYYPKSNTIELDRSLTTNQLLETTAHEMAHVYHCKDGYLGESTQAMEVEADRYANLIMRTTRYIVPIHGQPFVKKVG